MHYENIVGLSKCLPQMQEDLPVSPLYPPSSLLPSLRPTRIGLVFFENPVSAMKPGTGLSAERGPQPNFKEFPSTDAAPPGIPEKAATNSHEATLECSITNPATQEIRRIEKLLLPPGKKADTAIEGGKEKIKEEANYELPLDSVPEPGNEKLDNPTDETNNIYALIPFGDAEEVSRVILDQKSKEKCYLTLSLSEPNSTALPAANSSQDQKRLTIFPSLLNEKVGMAIEFFQNKADGFFSRALGRSQAYNHMMKKIFREKNLPEELVYLALIESGYNPHAQSRAKASGIWQFLSHTGRRYGLKVNKWVDERRDPEKSTYAAAEYLNDLYGIFNNWELAAASYNAGEGKVLRAMQRTNSQDFWKISQYRYLKRETKQYVPLFLAAVRIANEPQKYGFGDVEFQPPLIYEKISVPPATSLNLIAKATESNLNEIRELNPALKKEKTPPNDPYFEVKIPPGKKEIFKRNYLRLCSLAGQKAKKHRVRSGETLARIAKRHGTSVQTLCNYNKVSAHTQIKPGMTILLPPA